MCFFHWHHSLVMVCLVMLGLGVFLYLALRIAFHGLPGNNISWSWHCRTCQKHSFKYHIWKPIAPVFALSQFIYLWGFHFVTCMVMSVLIFFFFCFYFHWAHLMACLAMLVPGIYLLFFYWGFHFKTCSVMQFLECICFFHWGSTSWST